MRAPRPEEHERAYPCIRLPCPAALPPLQYCPHCLSAGGPGDVSDDGRLIWPVGVNGFCGDMYYTDGVRPNVNPQRDHEAGGRFATGAQPPPTPLRPFADVDAAFPCSPQSALLLCVQAARLAPCPPQSLHDNLPRSKELPSTCPALPLPCPAEEVGGVYEEGSVMQVSVGITAHHNGRFQFRICRILAPGPGQTWAQAEKAQLSEECFNQVGLAAGVACHVACAGACAWATKLGRVLGLQSWGVCVAAMTKR